MARHARFRVDPRLAVLLGESYQSTEHALKELVDNCWDADAQTVRITLPGILTAGEIRIEDDGTGMTQREVREVYLAVADDRYSRKVGARTQGKGRKIKGRKGIGKFAGLVAADAMTIETCSRGACVTLTIRKDDLLAQKGDLEALRIPVTASRCPVERHGTTVTLSCLSQRLNFPKAESLRSLLLYDYGRESDFRIYVNSELLAVTDVPGRSREETADLPRAGHVVLRFSVCDERRALKHPGIAVRVDGKLVGRPVFLGLDSADDFPVKLLKRIYGELEADGLYPDVTSGWGEVLENSAAMAEVAAWAAPLVRETVAEVYGQEMQLAMARVEKAANERLSRLPEYKRDFADQAIKRILKRYYGESEERVTAIVSVVLDAVEHDDYRKVLEAIDQAKSSDVAALADALQDSSLLEMAIMVQQLQYRLRILDDVQRLVEDPATLEKHLHKALEGKLWILGNEFSLMVSNRSLDSILAQLGTAADGGEADRRRPDLVLASDYRGNYVVVELKRPSHTLQHGDYTQAIGYRHALSNHLKSVDVIVLGGERELGLETAYTEKGVRFLTYMQVLSVARSQIEWLRRELGQRTDGGLASASITAAQES